MLTSEQCQVVAYMTDGSIVCRECGDKLIEQWLFDNGVEHEIEYEKALAALKEKQHGYVTDWDRDKLYGETQDNMNAQAMKALSMSEIIEYTMSSEFGEGGCSCDDCGKVLCEDWSEPEED